MSNIPEYCFYCGCKLRENAEFCEKCGKKVIHNENNSTKPSETIKKPSKIILPLVFVIALICIVVFSLAFLSPHNAENSYQSPYLDVNGTFYGTINTDTRVNENYEHYEIQYIKIGNTTYPIYISFQDYTTSGSAYYSLIGLNLYHKGNTINFELERYGEWYRIKSYHVLDNNPPVNNNPPEPDSNKFIGTWSRPLGYQVIGYDDDTVWVTFRSDGSLTASMVGDFANENMWSIENGVLSVGIGGMPNIAFSYSFSNNDRTLTIKSLASASYITYTKQ